MALTSAPLAQLVEITSVNKHFVPKDYHTVTLDIPYSEATATWSNKTFTICHMHSIKTCDGRGCVLHPLNTPLFAKMARGDIDWGSFEPLLR